MSPIFDKKVYIPEESVVLLCDVGLEDPSDQLKLFVKDVINLLSKLLNDDLHDGYKPISETTPDMSWGIVDL